jgi:hypothetical protein
MMKFKSLIDSLYESDFIGCLDESGASLSRVLSVLDSGVDFVFITASRASNSKKENTTKNNDLLKFIRSEVGQKIGAYKIIGHWKECSDELKDGETIADCKGSVQNSLEETWLITKPDTLSSDEFNEIAQKVARKYEQDAYVIRLNGKLTLNGKDGSEWADLGDASKSSLSSGFEKIVNVQGYSELSKLRKKGRSAIIVFEGIYGVVPKDSISSKLLFQESNILY